MWASLSGADLERHLANCQKLAKEDQSACREQLRLEIESAKIQVEGEKLEREHSPDSRFVVTSIISGLAIGVPLIVVAVTVRSASKARSRDERVQFQLKAAEIVMSAENSRQAEIKAEMLERMFEGHLPQGFSCALSRKDLKFGPADTANKLEILRILAAYPRERQAIVRYMAIILDFEGRGRQWFDALAKEIEANPPTDGHNS